MRGDPLCRLLDVCPGDLGAHRGEGMPGAPSSRHVTTALTASKILLMFKVAVPACTR
jgi:hypothetical protein